MSANADATGVGARRSGRRTTVAKSDQLSREVRIQRLDPPVRSGSEFKTAAGKHPFVVVAMQVGEVCRDGGTLLPAVNGHRHFIAVIRCDEALARAPPLTT